MIAAIYALTSDLLTGEAWLRRQLEGLGKCSRLQDADLERLKTAIQSRYEGRGR